jgi:hypothetical protein
MPGNPQVTRALRVVTTLSPEIGGPGSGAAPAALY